ncbi:hypothetical protein ACJMK2_000601 [Sinanodonta woodiana]|uniref:Uncharacterized protein n=1 Tax=Sinanodonta woodiana TaxID=1069815 RepID=A0ABD3XRM8_SINWO
MIKTSFRVTNVWRLILYLSILVTVLPISEASSTCTFDGIYYLCNNIATQTDFLLVLPTNVRKVTLMGTNELASFPELSIIEFTNIKHIKDGFLAGLGQLKFLSISSCTNLDEIDKDIFYSTPNIEALHMDGNTRLRLAVVEAALIDKLENLRYLSLIGIQAVEHHIVLGDNFLRALRGKNLTYLDISRVPGIYIQQAIVPNLFKNLKYFNCSYSKPGMTFNTRLSFQNIDVFDVTGVQYDMLKYWIKSGERRIDVADIPKTPYMFYEGVNNPDNQISFN